MTGCPYTWGCCLLRLLHHLVANSSIIASITSLPLFSAIRYPLARTGCVKVGLRGGTEDYGMRLCCVRVYFRDFVQTFVTVFRFVCLSAIGDDRLRVFVCI